MSTRQRKKEIEVMRREAAQLWAEQQIALEHANRLAKRAGRHLSAVGREEVLPRVVRSYDAYVRPTVMRTLAKVNPAFAPKKKKSSGVFWVVAGLVALIGAIGFFAYQTVRDDDELWMADESDQNS